MLQYYTYMRQSVCLTTCLNHSSAHQPIIHMLIRSYILAFS